MTLQQFLSKVRQTLPPEYASFIEGYLQGLSAPNSIPTRYPIYTDTDSIGTPKKKPTENPDIYRIWG
jgi:hypothetical protein